MRMTTRAITEAVAAKIKENIPEAEVYMGSIEEKAKRPAFLYLPIYSDEKKVSLHTSRKTLELQIIFFGRTDGAGKEDFMQRMEVLDRIDGFLQSFELEVLDRILHFESETKDADGQMAIYLRFQFLDEAEGTAAEKSETAEHVAVNLFVNRKE